MSEEFNINSNLFNSLNELIINPFFIMDQQGNLLSFNKNASDLFNISELCNIFDILDPHSAEVFHSLIENCIIGEASFKNPITIVRNNTEIKTRISIVSYLEGNHTFLFCEMENIADQKNESEGSFNIIIIDDDEQLNEIKEAISEEFPLTVTGREKLRKLLDKSSNIVWLEDLSGKILLVNKQFQSYFNVNYDALEGNSAEKYILPVYQPLWNSLNNIVLLNGYIVRVENLFFNNIGTKGEQEIVKSPVYDNKKKMLCILGIIKPAIKEDNLFISNRDQSLHELVSLIKHFPKPAAIISPKGIIISHNNSFAEIFNDGIYSEGIHLDKVMTSDVIDNLDQFINNKNNEVKFSCMGNYYFSGRKIETFHVYLNKIMIHDVMKGIFIIVEEEQCAEDNLDNLIRKRGLMFEILIEKNPEPVFIYNTENLRFLEVNEAALNLYGYRREEFLQMDLTDLYTPEDIQTLLDSSVTKENYGKFSGPYRHRKKNGSSVFVEISKISFKFNDKDAHYNIIKDVSENLELQKKLQIYKSAFDNSESLVFITDNIGIITYANKAVYENLNYSNHDIHTTSFAALVKNEERGIVNSSIFYSDNKDSLILNISLKKADGTLIKSELNASPVRDYKGDIESFIILCKIDNTEQEVKNIKENAIPESSKEIIPTDFDKGFLSSMFHEILTPINVIIGFIQELTDSESNSAEQKEAIEIINQNRLILLNSMNSVAEYINLQKNSSEIKIDEISITEIIDYLQKDIEELSSSKDIQFSYGKISSSLTFETDKQKFQNLISSLLRIITEINSGNRIFFSAYQHSDNRFVISVKDNYSSISEDLLDKIKAVFTQENSKDYGVSKLAIKLSRKLLNLLNGRFELITKENDKTDYGFIFPQKFSFNDKGEPFDKNIISYLSDNQLLNRNHNTIENPSSPNLGEITSKDDLDINGFKENENIFSEEDLKIIEDAEELRRNEKVTLSELNCLYIEDQIDSQILFKVQMKELKDIKYAVSFEEALPLLDNYHFDFIVMDINLQGEYNGLDALKIIHKMPKYEKIPIIAVTAYVLPGDKEKFIVTGFHDFISKPIFREKMIESLGRIFRMQF